MRHFTFAAAGMGAFSLLAIGGVEAGSIDDGRAIAKGMCSACHAISREDVSQLSIAPPFRALGQRYPLESLEESLAEGIVTGHEGMPEFQLDPEEIDAFLTYLASIQVSG